MGVPCVRRYGTVSFVHRPVVGQTIGIGIFRLVLLRGGIHYIPIGVIERKVVYIRVNRS